MNILDIKNLIKSGHKIGAHTINHYDLKRKFIYSKKINNYKKNFNKYFGKKKLIILPLLLEN